MARAAAPFFDIAVSIEIDIGLPHLNKGPILARARRFQQPTLISANALSLRSSRRREWTGWRIGQLANAHGLAALGLDSAGYVAIMARSGTGEGRGKRRRGSRPFSGEPPMTYPLFAAFAAATEQCAKATSLLDIARILADRLAKGTSVSRQTLKSMMRQRFGGSDAWGEHRDCWLKGGYPQQGCCGLHPYKITFQCNELNFLAVKRWGF